MNVNTIGFLAAFLTTAAFAPQVMLTWRTGGRQLSWLTLVLFGAGVGLWFLYGAIERSGPIMIANGMTGVQILAIGWIKLRAALGTPPDSTSARR